MTIKLKQYLLILTSATLLAACGSISLTNPFGSNSKAQPGIQKNATEYLCEGNKRFYVRMLNNGNDAWLIYPTHEVNLAKEANSTNRYVSGVITLVINGDETTLNDGDKLAYTACKAQVRK